MTDDVRSDGVPFDRLTEIAEEVSQNLNRPEYEDVKCIVFLTDGERSGIKMHGYEDPVEGVADLFVHMKAIFESTGRTMEFVAVPESPEGLS